MADHDLRPECAELFGKISAEISGLRDDTTEHRAEYREIRKLITANREAVLDAFAALREDVAGLKVRAKGWSAIIAALVSVGIAMVVAAFSG